MRQPHSSIGGDKRRDALVLESIQGRLVQHSASTAFVCYLNISRACINPSFLRKSRYQHDEILESASVGHPRNRGTARPFLPLDRNVGLLGSHRRFARLEEENLVPTFAYWILVGKLHLLLGGISSPNPATTKGGPVKSILLRIFITIWGVVFAGVLILGLFPRLLLRVPYPEAIRPLLILLILATIGFAIARLYSEGIKNARRK